MSTGIQLIVGLGNPGAEYENTRHNAGAWFVENIANSANLNLRPVNRFHGKHAVFSNKDHDCHLLIPSTFMNLSGQAVGAIASYYKIPPHNILIAHDEIDLAIGDIRLKYEGGHGGHNGLRDIIRHLNTNKFYRLRIGVGHPGTSKDVADYVLNLPKKAEREAIENALDKAQILLPKLFAGQYQPAMHQLHTRETKHGN